jgi:hypothetical protein
MKLIGYWMETLNDTDLPLPHELIGEMPELARQAVCRYVSGGTLFESYRGLSWCRFYCGVDDREMGFREFTDGEWVWPEGLVHYVRSHNIVLPDEFIATALARRAPVKSDDGRPSLDFWLDWAGKRRIPSIRRRLAEALAVARSTEPAVVETIIEELRQREGEGIEQCNFAGCAQRVLKGRRICARHILTKNELQWRTHHLYKLPHQYEG